jgi:RNA polymerase sigma-32 factor
MEGDLRHRPAAFEEGDMHPEYVVTIARDLGVTDQDVVDMNRRLNHNASLNMPIRADVGRREWQDWLIALSSGDWRMNESSG